MKKLLCATAMVAAMAMPSFATDCIPVDVYARGLTAAGIRNADVRVTKNPVTLQKYMQVANFELPADSSPIGMILVDKGDIVVAVFVEPSFCVAYQATTPRKRHDVAVAAAYEGN